MRLQKLLTIGPEIKPKKAKCIDFSKITLQNPSGKNFFLYYISRNSNNRLTKMNVLELEKQLESDFNQLKEQLDSNDLSKVAFTDLTRSIHNTMITIEKIISDDNKSSSIITELHTKLSERIKEIKDYFSHKINEAFLNRDHPRIAKIIYQKDFAVFLTRAEKQKIDEEFYALCNKMNVLNIIGKLEEELKETFPQEQELLLSTERGLKRDLVTEERQKIIDELMECIKKETGVSPKRSKTPLSPLANLFSTEKLKPSLDDILRRASSALSPISDSSLRETPQTPLSPVQKNSS